MQPIEIELRLFEIMREIMNLRVVGLPVQVFEQQRQIDLLGVIGLSLLRRSRPASIRSLTSDVK